MARYLYSGDDAVQIPAAGGIVVKPGEEVELPDDVLIPDDHPVLKRVGPKPAKPPRPIEAADSTPAPTGLEG